MPTRPKLREHRGDPVPVRSYNNPASPERRAKIVAGAKKPAARKRQKARAGLVRKSTKRLVRAKGAARKATRRKLIAKGAKTAKRFAKRRAGNAAVNRYTPSRKAARKSKGKSSSGRCRMVCAPAKPVRVKAKGKSWTMCRDEAGVTRKRSGKKRRPGSFSKRAAC